jgi:hypothetical protein
LFLLSYGNMIPYILISQFKSIAKTNVVYYTSFTTTGRWSPLFAQAQNILLLVVKQTTSHDERVHHVIDKTMANMLNF